MTEERKSALTQLKTVKGQIEGIIKMIEDDRYCIDVSNQILASVALLKKANIFILQGHLKNCVKQSIETGSADEDEKMDEIMNLLKRMNQ